MPTETPTSAAVITGCQLIGGQESPGGALESTHLQAFDPSANKHLPESFAAPSGEQMELACQLATRAFPFFRDSGVEDRAQFLEAIAEELEALRSALVQRAMLETALPQTRIDGELNRTIGQFHLFAEELRTGRYLRLTVDTAQPDRKPLPRPALQTMRMAIGPVAVFGASNFPLAYSVAGGDTASALAAGCPVIARAHPAHPGTAELAGRAITAAVVRCGLHPGVFSMLTGVGNALGEAIVQHPAIAGVGFTGSRRGGLSLQTLAQSRPVPIPVFAEMSSINPVFLLPAALEAKAETIAEDFVVSMTQGIGQFCTNPGLVIGIAGRAWDRFVQAASASIGGSQGGLMLTPGISEAYKDAATSLFQIEGVETIAQGNIPENAGPGFGRPLLSVTTAKRFLADKRLSEEHFGPASLLVLCETETEIFAVANSLEGQLTSSLLFEAEDHATAQSLLSILTGKAGRLIANGFPTGVEVGHAIVHGGPYPATTDNRWTSVGAAAIERWLRPVCFQNFPTELLPEPLSSPPASFPVEMDGKLRERLRAT